MRDVTRGRFNIVDRVWRLFASMRLALFLIFLLALISIIGTVIPQGRADIFYIAAYGERLAAWLIRLDLTKMYNSGWFSSILAIFALNIIVCTMERFPVKWRTFRKGEADQSLDHIKALPTYTSLNLGAVKTDLLKRNIRGLLRSRNYRIAEMAGNNSSSILLKAYKGRLNRFGSDIVHLGIIVILLGGIIGSVTGFREYKPIPVGETVKIDSVDFDLEVRANRFWMDNYESGEVKQYYSDLTLLENGGEVLKNGILYVNKPLIYKGIWFYQTSYGEAWDRVDDVTLSLYDRKEEKAVGTPFKVKWQATADIPGLKGYSLKPVAFVADFAIDTANKNWYARSIKHDNPAIQVELYKKGEFISWEWIFLNFPNIFQIFGEGSNSNLILTTYTATPYTALNIVRDKGVNIVWAGSIFMMIGLFLSFFVHHRRISIISEKEGKDFIIHLAGSAHRDKVSFTNELKGIAEAIRNNTSKEEE